MSIPEDPHRSEAEGLARAGELLRSARPPLDTERSWQRIAARIRAEREWQQALALGRNKKPHAGFWAWFGSFALGAAAALVVVGLLPRGLWQPSEQSGLEALGGRPEVVQSAERSVLTVAFRPGVGLAEVGRLVRELEGEVIGGPSALALWRVAVPAARRDEALARLRASPLVEAVATEP
ncbi:MAG: hypothetical protein NZ533_02775 [Casimicrobiaceae bacterium]|nr:hypothetical protein [Casimicrobiaceae bacterium]MDW8311844.1 hypothetical protein [Burkholderiales bacterium]